MQLSNQTLKVELMGNVSGSIIVIWSLIIICAEVRLLYV